MAAKSKQPFSGLTKEIRSILTQSDDYSSDDDEISDKDQNVKDDSHHDNDNSDVNDVVAERQEEWQIKKNKRKQRTSPSSVEDRLEKTKVATEVVARSHDAVELQQANDEMNNGAKHIIYVRGESIKLTACNPFTVRRDIEKSFGEVSRIECRGTSLKITCISEQQKEQILRSTHLGDVAIVTSLPNSEKRKQQEATQPRHQRVVITGVPKDINDRAVIEETGAIEVRRIYKRSSGTKEPTTALVLSYNCSIEEIPSRVQIGYLTFKTRTYIPLVTRCYKCQKYGHIAANCRKEKHTCPVCAGPHSYEECHTKDSKKCANCGGAHSVSFRECPKYVMAKQVTHRAATYHMSYRDALVQIRQEQRRTAIQEPSETTEVGPPPLISQRETHSIHIKPTSSEECTNPIPEVASTSTKARSASTSTSATVTSAEYITDKDLYRLLAMIIKLSESQVSKSSFICYIVDYVSSKMNRSSEAINKNIRRYAKESPLTTPPRVPTLTCSEQNSSSNTAKPS